MASDADEPDPILDSEAEAPPSRRRGIALCLSGGGLRATLFHLGAIQTPLRTRHRHPPRLRHHRLRAPRAGFALSGGSITAAQWAIAEAQAATSENRPLDFTRDIARPLQALTSRDIRTGAMAKKFLLPWNWFRGAPPPPSAAPTWPSERRKVRRTGEVDEAAKRACPATSSSNAIAWAPTSPATRRQKASRWPRPWPPPPAKAGA